MRFIRPSIIIAMAIVMPLGSSSASAAGSAKTKVSKETARQTALKSVEGGEVLNWDLELENGKPIYSFDIKGKDGRINEVEISGDSGKQVELSFEIESGKPGAETKRTTYQKDLDALKKAKLTREEAEEAALKKIPGAVQEWEVEIDDGKLIYEFLISTKNNEKKVIEVDAKTGKAGEINTFVDGDGI